MDHHVARFRQRHSRSPKIHPHVIIVLVILGGVTAVGVLFSINSRLSPPKTYTGRHDPPAAGAERYAAQRFARNTIEPLLLSPASAKWPWDSVKSAEIHRGPRYVAWQVSGLVDAKNAYGVPLRHSWTVWLVCDRGADTLQAVQVALDGQGVAGSNAELLRIRNIDR